LHSFRWTEARHDVTGLNQTIALAEPILAGLGFGFQRVATHTTDDPHARGASLRAIHAGSSVPRLAIVASIGGKRKFEERECKGDS
jgi:hypothetical protein